MKKFLMLALAMISLASVANASSLENQLQALYSRNQSQNSAAKAVYDMEFAAAEAKYQAVINSTETDISGALFSGALNIRNNEQIAAGQKYTATVNANNAAYVNAANSACRASTGRNCVWN